MDIKNLTADRLKEELRNVMIKRYDILKDEFKKEKEYFGLDRDIHLTVSLFLKRNGSLFFGIRLHPYIEECDYSIFDEFNFNDELSLRVIGYNFKDSTLVKYFIDTKIPDHILDRIDFDIFLKNAKGIFS